MKRREFITLLGGAAVAWPLTARAQQSAKLRTIGFLGAGAPSSHGQWFAAFVQRLRELGWIEGRTVAIEDRWTEGHDERFAKIVTEFIRLKVNVIVTNATTAALAAKQATFRGGGGPGRHRLGCESGATGRQRHRPVEPVNRSRCQAPRTLAGGCPQSQPIGDHRPCRGSHRRAGVG